VAGEVMNQYIITEEELLDTRSYIYHEDEEAFIKIERNVRSHPYQSEREISFSSTDLLLISHDEWKRREERKHIHDRIDWTAGWISGFLTSRKFVHDRIEELRQQAGEP
jgi:hypothetical protein